MTKGNHLMPKVPYEESLHVPLIMRWPGVLDGGRRCDVLTAPAEIFPSLSPLSEADQLQNAMELRLDQLLKKRNDQLVPCTSYSDWFDSQRRIIRNLYGPLNDPEAQPDWALLS